jgi:hypothetical protein
MYAPYPPGYGLLTFGVGMAVGAAIWGDCHWGWGHSDIDIDINRYNEFNRNTSINAERYNVAAGRDGRGGWQHNPEHRKGVNYRNQDVARQFGASGGSSRVSREQARGWSGTQAGNRPAGSGAAGNRAQVADRARAPGAGSPDRSRPSAGTMNDRAGSEAATRRDAAAGSRQGASNRQSPSTRPTVPRETALTGSVGGASRDRAASSRGAASRGAASFGGLGAGGGARGGGLGRR